MNAPRILLVDDDPKLSELVHFFLKRAGRFDVCIENRSARALETARTFRPDVVLLDVDMPGKDGGEVEREIKADPQCRNVQVIFLTSLISREESGDAAAIRGGMLFLPKPVNPKVLISTLDQVLGREMMPS